MAKVERVLGRVDRQRGRTWRTGAAVLVATLCLSAPARAQGDAPAVRSPSGPPGEVLDRVVAVVGGEVVTLSALELEARVWLVERGALDAADAPLGQQALRAALELSLSQRLQVQDAERLEAFPVEPAEVEARLARLRGQFPGEAAFQAFLARHDADVPQLAALLARALRAERVLDRRIRLRALVTDAEVRRHYDAQGGDLGDVPFESVREALRERLHRERYARLAREELARVRAEGDVRRVAPFAREALPEAGGSP